MKKFILFFILTSCLVYGEQGFLENEIDDGLNKICVYSTVYGMKAINIRISQTCPVVFNF